MLDRQQTSNVQAASMFQVDVNGDGEVAPLDVLLIINHLRASSQSNANGESVDVDSNAASLNAGLAVDNTVLSMDTLEKKRQR